MERGLQEGIHFLVSAGGIAVALLIIAGLLHLVRRVGWAGPTEVSALLETWLGTHVTKDPQVHTVNVEYVDTDGSVRVVSVCLGPQRLVSRARTGTAEKIA